MATGYKALSWDAKIDAELAEWPGVTARREGGRKHQRLILAFSGQERFVVYPSSPSDWRGLQNKITDIRHTLISLGAKRNERRKATVRRSRNKQVRDPLARIEAAPVKQNPWSAFAAYVPPPPPEPTISQRIASGIVAVWRRLKGSVRSTTSPTAEGGDAQTE